MLTSRMLSQGSSPAYPPRWITASAPRHASVIAAMSVTEAWIASSFGPAVTGATSSRRRVRPGAASRDRSIVPICPAAPVITIVGTCGSSSKRSEGRSRSGSEDDDAAEHLAPLHLGERVLDLAERDRLRD